MVDRERRSQVGKTVPRAKLFPRLVYVKPDYRKQRRRCSAEQKNRIPDGGSRITRCDGDNVADSQRAQPHRPCHVRAEQRVARREPPAKSRLESLSCIRCRRERCGEGFSIGEPKLGIERQAAVDRCRERRRNPRGDTRNAHRSVVCLPTQQLRKGRLFEWKPAAQCQISNDAERVDVAAAIDAIVRRLLGTHEMRCAHDALVIACNPWLCTAMGNSEIHDDGAPARRLEHDVVGLHVAMDYAASMSVGQRPCHFAHDSSSIRRLKWSTRSKAFAERFAFDVAHDEEYESVSFANPMYRDDVRMREPGGGARLSEESLTKFLHAREAEREDLDRNVSVELNVAGEIHDSHPATTQLALERILAGESRLQLKEFVRRLSHSESPARHTASGTLNSWPSFPRLARSHSRYSVHVPVGGTTSSGAATVLMSLDSRALLFPSHAPCPNRLTPSYTRRRSSADTPASAIAISMMLSACARVQSWRQ